MSRRRTARDHRHLERTAEVAQLLEEEPESKGPCPGSCNRLHRARSAERAALVDAARARVTAEFWEESLERFSAAMLVPGQEYSSEALDEIAKSVKVAAGSEVMSRAGEIEEYATAAGERVKVPEPRPGRPVWCLRCSADIRHAVEALPQLLLWLLDMAIAQTPERPDGSLVTDPVEVLAVTPVWPDAELGEYARFGRVPAPSVVETLGCGHRLTRALGPAPAARVCRTCVVSAIAPEPGRLAPAPKAARGASGRPRVSPAGSPAWVEADAAIQWVCSRTEQARVLLDRRLPDGEGEYEWRDGSTHARVREAARAARDLRGMLPVLLEGDRAELYGREALGVWARLRSVTGSDVLVHQLPARCPRCSRRALERTDGSGYVRCRACGAHWEETHYQHLARTQAWEAQHPEKAQQEESER